MSHISQRLQSEKVVILDGGIGTEVFRRGAAINDHLSCCVAHYENPDLVREVHIDYIRAGAEVITTNTFGTARHILEPTRYGDDVEAINRAAVKIAQEARDEAAEGEVWIAGSISSMPALSEMQRTPAGAKAADNYREQADILANAGVDLLICEMMLDRENASLVIEAAKGTGLPVWVGCSAEKHQHDLMAWREEQYEELPTQPFDALLRDLLPLGGDVIGIMHSYVEAINAALVQLKQYWDGPILAYAETRYFERQTYILREDMAPANYAQVALQWRDAGVHVIGGCCGTGPEHIRAIAQALRA